MVIYWNLSAHTDMKIFLDMSVSATLSNIEAIDGFFNISENKIP